MEGYGALKKQWRQSAIRKHALLLLYHIPIEALLDLLYSILAIWFSLRNEPESRQLGSQYSQNWSVQAASIKNCASAWDTCGFTNHTSRERKTDLLRRLCSFRFPWDVRFKSKACGSWQEAFLYLQPPLAPQVQPRKQNKLQIGASVEWVSSRLGHGLPRVWCCAEQPGWVTLFFGFLILRRRSERCCLIELGS